MLVYQQSLPKHLCFHDACALQMTKRRRQRSEAQKAAARRGREAQAAAASSPNAAAIVLATAGAPAPAPRAPFPPPSGALIAPPPHRCRRTGHCSCSRCSGRRSPSRATNRAEAQSILLSRCMSQAPCPCTPLRFARMRRCARPRHRQRCGAACRRCRCLGGLGCTDRALHVGRAAARLAGPAAVCLRLRCSVAMRTPDRPSTRLRL